MNREDSRVLKQKLGFIKIGMGSEDRNFWITDIGGRFRGLYCFGCKEMRKSLSAPTTATTSASKKSGDIPPLSNGKAVAITPSSSSAGSQKKGKTTAPSSSTAADVGAKRKHYVKNAVVRMHWLGYEAVHF
ncbi:hypothetical protein C5167_040527 [Papaver somniferum]|uniref:Uncharacterized protein n=1 Tax=Papaver somniferum TaxID=3469 RepID=A0A4Y7IJF3_PAPSO|nr:hypothetical protein C5167_040527 [Papaver somniferum]